MLLLPGPPPRGQRAVASPRVYPVVEVDRPPIGERGEGLFEAAALGVGQQRERGGGGEERAPLQLFGVAGPYGGGLAGGEGAGVEDEAEQVVPRAVGGDPVDDQEPLDGQVEGELLA